MISKTVSGQTPISYSYDSQSRLSSIAQGASIVGMFYDVQSRPISMSLPLSMTVDYGYDGQGRLINMVYKRLGVQFGDLGYGYDNQGRRVRMTGSLARVGLPQTVAGTNYNAANQLTSWNGATLTYDANGNMTSDGTSTFVWNARNQLSSMTGAASTSFVYDTLGRRISKTINGVTTQYLYDGDNVAKEIKGGQNASVLTGGTDQLFSRTDLAGQRTMVADGLGSMLGLVDNAGNTMTSYTYDAFGGTTAAGAASDNSNQYTSRENDGAGLYFYRARYYSVRFGRFISEDPARQAGSGLNLFAYAKNDPVNFKDPSGLDEDKDKTCDPRVRRYNLGSGQKGIYIGSCYTNQMNEISRKFSDAATDLSLYSGGAIFAGEAGLVAMSGILEKLTEAGGLGPIGWVGAVIIGGAGVHAQTLAAQISKTSTKISECKDYQPAQSVFIGYPDNAFSWAIGNASVYAYCLPSSSGPPGY